MLILLVHISKIAARTTTFALFSSASDSSDAQMQVMGILKVASGTLTAGESMRNAVFTCSLSVRKLE